MLILNEHFMYFIQSIKFIRFNISFKVKVYHLIILTIQSTFTLQQIDRQMNKHPSSANSSQQTTGIKSSSKKAKYRQQQQFEIDENSLEMLTPKQKKSSSTITMTSSKYLQLQLQVSGRKKQAMERTLQQKDRRIAQLQELLKDSQTMVAETIDKWKQFQEDYRDKENKVESLSREIQELKAKCKKMAEGSKYFKQLETQTQQTKHSNLLLEEENTKLKAQLEIEKKKYINLKALRKKQKQQWRSILPEFIQEFQQVKNQFLNMPKQSRFQYAVKPYKQSHVQEESKYQEGDKIKQFQSSSLKKPNKQI